MLQLVYANTGKPKAFKKAMFRLSSKLLENGFAIFVGFNETFSVATLHLDTFQNPAILGSTLNIIHSTLSSIALDIDNFDCANLYPDIVRFCKNQ